MDAPSARPFRFTDILPLFDRRSRLLYAILLVSIPVTWGAYLLSGLTLKSWNWFYAGISVVLIFSATMLRRGGREKTSTALETIALMVSQGIVIALLQFPLIAAGFPMADTLLNSVDNALGFDWNRFAARFNTPLHLDLLAFAYRSMTWQALLALALLSIRREIDRAWRLVTASLVALMITASIFVFFPADGSLALCGQSDVPVYGNYCAYQSLIRQVNSGAVVAVDRSMQIGMVSFPSFHTSAAILLAWAVWPFRFLRWPSVALNVAMIVGTIVIGSHYLIDILGGIAVAVAAIAVAKRWV